MRSFRDDPTPAQAEPQPESPAEIRARISRFYVDAIEALYPLERVNETFWVRDDGDGPYIYKWASEDSEPDQERIHAKVAELAKKADEVEAKKPRPAVVRASEAVGTEVARMLRDGYFEFSGKLVPLRAMLSMESVLTRNMLAPITYDVPLLEFDPTAGANRTNFVDVSTVRHAYTTGSEIIMALDAHALKMLNDMLTLSDEALNRIASNPKAALDKTGRAVTFKVKFPFE